MDITRKNRYLDKIQKVETYSENLDDWITHHPIDDLDEKQDLHWIFAIIHIFQNIAEVLADVSAMILKDENIPVKDNYTNYEILYNREIISRRSWESLRKINGLRNRITHKYNGLNYKIAWDAMQELEEQIQEILEELKKWLTKHS